MGKWPIFGDFQKLGLFRILGDFLKPFFAQSNSNEVLVSFHAWFLEFYFLSQSNPFAKPIALAKLKILAIFKKTCHFSNIRCFLKPFFAHSNSHEVLVSFYACFYGILIFQPKSPFCKAYSLCPVANFGDFQKLVIFRILGVF